MCRKGAGIATVGSLTRRRRGGQERLNEGWFDFARAAWGAPGPRTAASGRAVLAAPAVRDHHAGVVNSGGGGAAPGIPASLRRSRRRRNPPGGRSPLWIVADHAGHKPEFVTPCGGRRLNCAGNGTGRRRPAPAAPCATTPRHDSPARPSHPPPTACAAFPVANALPAADAPYAAHPTGREDPDGSAPARAISGIQLPGYRRTGENGASYWPESYEGQAGKSRAGKEFLDRLHDAPASPAEGGRPVPAAAMSVKGARREPSRFRRPFPCS